MKNGPVFSNISMINKCFLDMGSPLPYSIILDYLCMNWANGRGIGKDEASNLLNHALNANYYYMETSPQHYQRKSQFISELDFLFKKLKETFIPVNYNNKKVAFTLQKIYSDTRFSVITTDDETNYILLSEWNLLNDLAIKLLNTQIVKQPTVPKITQLIKEKYNIEDKNALFIPHIDNRFIVKKDGMVVLSELGYSNSDFNLKVEVTPFIKEEIARATPEIIKIFQNNIGIEIYLSSIIKEIYKLEIHKSAYPAYFEALKEYLQGLDDIYLQETMDKAIYLPKETSPNIIEKFRLHGNTNRELIETLIQKNDIVYDVEGKAEEKVSKADRSITDKVVYTLRYYDRIQETLTASYFIKWISNDIFKIRVLDDEISEYIFFYDKGKDILYGSQLEEFMCDYALEPGQRLEFTISNDKVYIKIGSVDKKAAAAQERYLDIGRMSIENSQSNKSLVQLISEALIYHPSGLHISEIIKYVMQYSNYAESSISSTLSKYDFFSKQTTKNGFWIFNPNKWKKSSITVEPKLEKNQVVRESIFTGKITGIAKVVELEEQYKKMAYDSQNHRKRIINENLKSWSKEKVLITAWENYAFLIYNLAKNYSTASIEPMDLIQESYFALNRAYDNYDSNISTSFYHYSKIYIKSLFARYIGDKKSLIRIPSHRTEELISILKKYELSILLGDNLNINEYENDLIIWNIDYISFEQLYTYFSMDNEDNYIYDDDDRASVSYPFLCPLDYEYNRYDKNSLNIIDCIEPEEVQCSQLIYEDNYYSDLLPKVFEYLKSKCDLRAIEILKLRIGLTYSGDWYTLEEIAKKYGLTRERIRQIEKATLKRARYYILRMYNKK